MPIKILELKDTEPRKKNKQTVKVAMTKLKSSEIAKLYKRLLRVLKRAGVTCRMNEMGTAIRCDKNPAYALAKNTQYHVQAMKDRGFVKKDKAFVTQTIWSEGFDNPLLVTERKSMGVSRWLIKAEFAKYVDELRNHYLWQQEK